jgi:hypothetical protein
MPLIARIHHQHAPEARTVEAFEDAVTGLYVNVAGVPPWHPTEPQRGNRPDWKRLGEIAQHPDVLRVEISRTE